MVSSPIVRASDVKCHLDRWPLDWMLEYVGVGVGAAGDGSVSNLSVIIASSDSELFNNRVNNGSWLEIVLWPVQINT